MSNKSTSDIVLKGEERQTLAPLLLQSVSKDFAIVDDVKHPTTNRKGNEKCCSPLVLGEKMAFRFVWLRCLSES